MHPRKPSKFQCFSQSFHFLKNDDFKTMKLYQSSVNKSLVGVNEMVPQQLAKPTLRLRCPSNSWKVSLRPLHLGFQGSGLCRDLEGFTFCKPNHHSEHVQQRNITQLRDQLISYEFPLLIFVELQHESPGIQDSLIFLIQLRSPWDTSQWVKPLWNACEGRALSFILGCDG